MAKYKRYHQDETANETYKKDKIEFENLKKGVLNLRTKVEELKKNTILSKWH